VYTHIGYNLRNTEVGAAVGLEQLKKLNGFVEKRRHNWDRLREGLEGMKNEFRYVTFHEGAEPSWFGFSMLCLKHSRRMITAYLNHHGIDTRYLFAGNITKQPAYAEVQYQVSPGGLPNTDTVMNNMFWVGVWPGLTDEHIDYVIDIIHKGEQKGWRI
jgi:CDP-6-deoxy-D-xylo-4-hexulose-3-dehydrase